MKNSYKTFVKLTLALTCTYYAQISLADLKMRKLPNQALPDATMTQPATAPLAQPTVQPDIALPASKLPADGSVQIQQSSPTTKPSVVPVNKLPNVASPVSSPAAPPVSRDMQMVKPVGNVGAQSQAIQITNQKWQDLQSLPDSTVIINKDGSHTSVGDVKNYKQSIEQTFSPKTPVNIVRPLKMVKQSPHTVNIKAVLAEENASAATAITTKSAVLDSLLACTDGCIFSINGKGGNRVIFTPGTAESAAKYVVSGAGFGTRQGSVYLTGGFNKRPILRVDSWRDDQITTYFEAGYAGEQDRNDVKLVVKLSSGKTFESPGNAKFYASRVQTVIGMDKIPDSRMSIEKPRNLTYSKAAQAYEFSYGSNYQTETDLRGFTDTINLTANGLFKPGFDVVWVGASIEQYPENGAIVSDRGCSGSSHTFGESSIAWVGDSIQIKRPMNNYSINPISPGEAAARIAAAAAYVATGGVVGQKGNTDCTSVNRFNAYPHSKVSGIEIVVEGPAGFSPF
jgi:hypothetical protein